MPTALVASSLVSTAPIDNPVIDLPNTSGSVYAGTCVALVLFGIGSMQLYFYIWTLKSLVLILWSTRASRLTINAGDVILGVVNIWQIIVKTYDDVGELEGTPT
ncbi:hypothetical protein K488DRAFT_88902 [Vararia minispora EC-137]|uniref:Uncharacterized protein n=1 Tax=Vararia minispora EC-137 TaxID=1314806 RepID=A0ACB8QCH3_9AGAM|nr:hypothetical protein K488DRAFT_88902 [Vararia minispora EC-137]